MNLAQVTKPHRNPDPPLLVEVYIHNDSGRMKP